MHDSTHKPRVLMLQTCLSFYWTFLGIQLESFTFGLSLSVRLPSISCMCMKQCLRFKVLALDPV